MSMVVYKYTLQTVAQQLLEMPAAAELLDVQMQGERAMLWAAHDTGNRNTKRIINMFMTGEYSPESEHMQKHIATIQHNGIVAHFFDGGEYVA